MKKRLIVLAAIAIGLMSAALYLHNPSRIVASFARQGFEGRLDDARLKYRISLFWLIPVAEAVFEPPREALFEGKTVYHLQARTRSLAFLSLLFNGFIELDSYVDKGTLNPLVYRERVFIRNKSDVTKEVRYDQAKAEMSIGGVRREILPGTQDQLSAIFRLRFMDFQRQKDFDININTNQKNYALKGSVYPKTLKAGGKTYGTLLLDATVSRRDKNPYHRSRISMILLKDAGNLPLLIRVFASGAVIQARLIEAETR